MTSVGADGLFAVNFSVDYLILFLICRVFGNARSRRVFACAVWIALSETLTVFPIPAPVCNTILWAARIGSAAILGLTANAGSFFKGGVYLVWFLSLDAIVTSFMTALFVRLPEPVHTARRFGAGFSPARLLPALLTFLSLSAVYLLLQRKRKCVGKAIPLHIRFNGREIDCSALCDSGNLLRDPISGLPVVIIGKEAARRLGNVGKDTLLRSGKLRLVPAKTVSGSVLLAAFVPELAKIGGKECEICVALDPQSTFYGGCEALIGADVL